MKKLIFVLVLLALPLSSVSAAADYYLKLGDIEGESTDSTIGDPDQPIITGQIPGPAAPGVEPDEIDARATDSDSAQGNVETEWKVEEGESAVPGVEPEEIDSKATDNGEPLQGIEPDEIDNKMTDEQKSNFAILIDSAENDEQTGHELGHILQQAVDEQAGDTVPMENISLNFGKIDVDVKQTVKLFGFIPIQTKAKVEIDAEERVKVKFPWWAVFAKKDKTIGDKVFTALANVLNTNEMMSGMIRNIR